MSSSATPLLAPRATPRRRAVACTCAVGLVAAAMLAARASRDRPTAALARAVADEDLPDDDDSTLLFQNGTLQGMTASLTKATWPVSDTAYALEWFLKFLPSTVDVDSCTNGTCTCGSQGRVSLAGSGFGLHAVNTSRAHCTDSALTVPAAEHVFAEKLEGMKTFDSFMDYNGARSREALDNSPEYS